MKKTRKERVATANGICYSYLKTIVAVNCSLIIHYCPITPHGNNNGSNVKTILYQSDPVLNVGKLAEPTCDKLQLGNIHFKNVCLPEQVLYIASVVMWR